MECERNVWVGEGRGLRWLVGGEWRCGGRVRGAAGEEEVGVGMHLGATGGHRAAVELGQSELEPAAREEV